MELNGYQRAAYRWLGPSVEASARANLHLRLSLKKAHIPLRPEVYLAYSYLNAGLAFVGSGVLVASLALLTQARVLEVPVVAFVFLVPLPLLLAGTIYALTFLLPDVRASSRARDIDAKLPYALNYVSTMAAAGVTPEKIFSSLAAQRIYGEVAHEAAWITRDLSLLGQDLITALTNAIERSPSIKFQDLLQGAITALTSGEDLKGYFLAKSEQFVASNRQEQRRFLDNLAVLAESYVTVVVAAPLFIIVLLSVFLMFGAQAENMFLAGYALVFLFLPLAQVGFALTASGLTPEA